MHPAPLRYLSAADVVAAMPDIDEQLRLAERTMVALVADAELPAKISVHPRPPDSFAHAMPAWMNGPATDGSADLLGLKWVAGFPSIAAASLPAIHGTIVLSDALTGAPRAVMDAGVITAHRTAAVSGVAIARWGPRPASNVTVAIIGAGVQARSHLPVIAHLLPEARVVLCDRDPARLAALTLEMRTPSSALGGFERVQTTTDAASAVEGADLVLTLVSFGPQRQVLPDQTLGPSSTIVAVDYDMCVPASVARAAGLFLVDHREQYLANRTSTVFAGYPDPGATIGEAVSAGTTRPAGRVLVTHLGVGLADVVFGDAILRTAEASGLGTILER